MRKYIVIVTRRASAGCNANARPAREPAKNAGDTDFSSFWREKIRNNVRYNEIVTDVARAVCSDLLFRRLDTIVLRLYVSWNTAVR